MNRFLKVRCNECKNEQIVFSRASTQVKCLICGAKLAVPTGGKAKIDTKIVDVFE